jgi:hypothetical protein
VVYDSKLFERGHMIRRWIDGVERSFTLYAIEEAPINKRPNKGWGAPPVGTLKAGIWGETQKIGPKHLQAIIHSDAPYSRYVIEGTRGPITPHGPWLKLPSNPAFGGRRTRFYSVSGQSANNFLARAAERTAVRHPSLRGFENAVFRQF